MTVPTSPPFDVPTDVAPFSKVAITRARLIELFEVNRSDFLDCVGLLYFEIVRPDADIFSDSSFPGFNVFCDLLVAKLTAAPTQLNKASVDGLGRFANFFGTAIAEHIDKQVRFQDLYAPDGEKKHSISWNLCLDFIAFVAIQAFSSGIFAWENDDAAKARNRLSELQFGRRQLRSVRGEGPYGNA